MQVDLPPGFMLPPPVEEVVAAGEEPDWLLARRGGVLLLRRTGRPELRATPSATQDTPDGRTTTATIAGQGGARLIVRRQSGICRTIRFGETTEFLTLSLPDGTTLRGCAAPDRSETAWES